MKSVRMEWVCIGVMLAALGCATGPARSALQESEVRERMLGGWEGSYRGKRIVLNLDGSRTNPTEGVTGNAYYNVRGDLISFGFNNWIVTARVTFPSQDTMVWTTVRTRESTEYRRMPIPAVAAARLGSRSAQAEQDLLNALQGGWSLAGEGDSARLDVSPWKLTLSGPEPLDSNYLLMGNTISFNGESGIRTHQVAFDADGAMTWTDVGTQRSMRFLRR